MSKLRISKWIKVPFDCGCNNMSRSNGYVVGYECLGVFVPVKKFSEKQYLESLEFLFTCKRFNSSVNYNLLYVSTSVRKINL